MIYVCNAQSQQVIDDLLISKQLRRIAAQTPDHKEKVPIGYGRGHKAAMLHSWVQEAHLGKEVVEIETLVRFKQGLECP